MDLIDLEIHLPWPPTVNHYYVETKHGRYISKKGKEYRRIVADYIFEQCGRLELNQRLMVSCVLYPPDKRKRDLDNYKKSLFDAITHAKLWEDDELIDQDFTGRGEIIKHGKAILFIANAKPIIPINNPKLIKTF